jgi:hypothetical protein
VNDDEQSGRIVAPDGCQYTWFWDETKEEIVIALDVYPYGDGGLMLHPRGGNSVGLSPRRPSQKRGEP